MKMAALRRQTCGINVGPLELRGLPGTGAEHLSSELHLELCTLWLILGSLCHLVGLSADDTDQLALLELIKLLFVVAFDLR